MKHYRGWFGPYVIVGVVDVSIHSSSLSNDIQFTKYTTGTPFFHDPYDLYGLCKTKMPLYGPNQFVYCILGQPSFGQDKFK